MGPEDGVLEKLGHLLRPVADDGVVLGGDLWGKSKFSKKN